MIFLTLRLKAPTQSGRSRSFKKLKCLYKSCSKGIFYIYIHIRTHTHITHVHTHTYIFQISGFQHQISIPGNLEANNISILYVLKNIQEINWQSSSQHCSFYHVHYRHQLTPSTAGILKAKEATVTAPLLGLFWSGVMTLDVTAHRQAGLDRPLNWN